MRSKFIVLLFFFILTRCLFAQTDSIVRVGACATPGMTWGVSVREDYTYVADYGRVTVVDISDPSSPWVVSSLDEGIHSLGALGIFVEDTLAYLNYTALGDGFSIVNTADPESLYVLGWCRVYPAAGPDPTGIYVIDTITYLASGNRGLMLIDVSNPSSPDTIRTYDTHGSALDIAVKDTFIYIANLDSLLVLNIADALQPFRVGAIDMPTGCYGVFVAGNYAYVACQSIWGYDGRVEVVDISDPFSPEIISSVNNIQGNPIDIYVSDGHAYVAAADYWEPKRGGKRKIGGIRPEGIKADVEGGLRVINISDPDSAYLIASYNTPGDPRGVFASDSLIFIADYDSLQILKYNETGIEEINNGLRVANYKLENYPNPFSHITNIQYSIYSPVSVSLKIYSISGSTIKTLVNETKTRGTHRVVWDRKDDSGNVVTGGVYFCRLDVALQCIVKKLVVIH